ncbi:MAG: 50S ribosomal protein L5 [Candidatus Eisenbacteria sp.]|nr:50S ribosomal protein L5 [Candidatus Eisenbacteria bacterium]
MAKKEAQPKDKQRGKSKASKATKAGKTPKASKTPKADKAAQAAKGKQGGKGKPERGAKAAPREPVPIPNLRRHYDTEVLGQLRKRFGYRNVHQVPRMKKIVLNMGVGDALQNPRFLDAAADDLSAIAGQRPAIRRARKSIANFKLREGSPIGTMVTLRGTRMYEFLERLISVAVPRIRDFRGLSPKGFDGRGNYSFGIKEQIIFPEIKYDKVEKIRGMDVTMVTSAENDEEGFALLKAMRMPFRER